MNAADASARLGMPYRRVIRWLEDGAMAGQKVGSEWRIDDAEVERVRGNLEEAVAPIAPELAVAGLLTEAVGQVRASAMREVITSAREIVRLADDGERRVHAGATGVATSELTDTLLRHAGQIAKLNEVFRGTAATYRAIRDHLVGIARLAEKHTAPPSGGESGR